MADSLAHRGPDDAGVWTDPQAGVGLGFRRLAILDLSPAGHQPMVSAEERFALVFNGEIYNHHELRNALKAKGHAFRGRSDTEVILAAFSEWGVEASVPRFWGMFAFALWDRVERRLWLGRDRLGKKPLYYGWQDGSFLFGSELRALRCHPAFAGGVDRGVLGLFLLHACVPSPLCIHPGLAQVPPGTILSLGPEQIEPTATRFWNPWERMPICVENGFEGDEAEAEEALLALLRSSVEMRREADVPVGAFLSGGIDSSLVTALLQEKGGKPIRTFTIGFSEAGFDETDHAGQVARHLGTDHVAGHMDAAAILDGVPLLPQIFDEPFADASQLPTYFLCRWARQDVVVALSGDGGDEAFAGYWRAFAAARLHSCLGRIPRLLRSPAASAMRAIPPGLWDSVTGGLGLGALTSRYRLSGDRLSRAGVVLASNSLEELHLGLLAHGRPDHWMAGGPDPLPDPWAGAPRPSVDPSLWMAVKDAGTYLPDDVLVKVDRASMAVGLEVRAPLLDHRIFEFAWSLPPQLRTGGGQGKRILRRLLRRYLPEHLVDGPKRGFEVPLGIWLRGPLRAWVETLLNEKELRENGLHAEPILQEWRIHLSGHRDRSDALWPLIVFLQWQKVWA